MQLKDQVSRIRFLELFKVISSKNKGEGDEKEGRGNVLIPLIPFKDTNFRLFFVLVLVLSPPTLYL